MSVRWEQAAFEQASRPTMERISDDRQRVSERLRPLLDYISEHLFEGALTVERLKRECGIADNSIVTYFHGELKLSPHHYIRECRFEVAARLLRDTELSITEIGKWVGYASIHAFSRSFERWSGMRPGAFRQASCRLPEEAEEVGSQMATSTLRRALADELEDGELARVLEVLTALYPEASVGGSPSRARPTALSELTAHEWGRVRAHLGGDAMNDPFALFEQLRGMSREACWTQPGQGVKLAELALGALYVESGLAPEALSRERARGWAWLANARRLDGNLEGAAEALAAAGECLGERDVPRAKAEVAMIQAACEWSEGKGPKALRTLAKATGLWRALGAREPLAESLLMKAQIVTPGGGRRACLEDLLEAVKLLAEGPPSRLRLVAEMELVTLHLEVGALERAGQWLSFAASRTEAVGDGVARAHLRRLEGLVAGSAGREEEAKRCLGEAARELEARADLPMAALVTLEWVVECGRSSSSEALEEHLAVARSRIAAWPLSEQGAGFPSSLEEARSGLPALRRAPLARYFRFA